jgi:hypothetical protein
VVVPSHWQGLTRQFFEKGTESPTADDWRIFAEAFGPLCLLELWGLYGVGTKRAYEAQRKIFNPKMDAEHLELIMALLEIIHLVFRPTLSETQLARAESRIATFTDLACRLHHGVTGIWNLHWLSHLPEDIRNFGPVYSFWCFASERFNKTLKNIKLNGHIKQVPMTLMRTFQNYAHLKEVSSFGHKVMEDTTDAVNQLAGCLKQVYRRCSRDVDGTTEQKRAAQWEQKDAESNQGTEASPISQIELDDGRRTALDRRWAARLHNHLVVTNPATEEASSNYHFLRENDETDCDDNQRTFVVTSRIVEHRQVMLGRRKFRAFRGDIDNDILAERDLRDCQDCFVEIRDPERVLDVLHGRAPVGLIVKIFSNTMVSVDETQSLRRTYLVVRYLKPYAYSEREPYKWRNL